MKQTAKDYINKLKPNMVDNWGSQASLLSYDDVAKLMDMYAELRRETELKCNNCKCTPTVTVEYLLKYTNDLVEEKPNESAYWHLQKLKSKMEEALTIPVVVGTLCECDGKIETTYDSEMNLVCKECYNKLLA